MWVLSVVLPAGSAQQYLGQEEYYSEPYGHSQAASEPMSQQYYPEGEARARGGRTQAQPWSLSWRGLSAIDGP